MITKPSECKGCPLYEQGKGFIPPMGCDSHKDVLILTTFPTVYTVSGRQTSPEAEQGKWFVGKAGRVMDKILWHAGMSIEDFGVVGLVQCMPKDLGILHSPQWEAAVTWCEVNRVQALEGCTPKAIVSMGDMAFNYLTGLNGIDKKRGYVYRDGVYDVPVVPTFHPNMLTAGESRLGLIPVVLYDLKFGPKKADRPDDDPELMLYPTPMQLAEFVDAAIASGWCAFDIETPEKDDDDEIEAKDPLPILRASLAYWDGSTVRSITFAWEYPYTLHMETLLKSGIDIVTQNGHKFDKPVVIANGYPGRWRNVDIMWLWHFLHPDLPKSLAHIATYYTDLPEWKSKADSDPVRYSALDAYATAKIYMGLMRDLKAKNMWNIAQRHVVDLLPVLKDMKDRGVCVDKAAVERLRVEIEKEKAKLQEDLNNAVPQEIRQYHPKYGYARTPVDCTGLVQREFEVPYKLGKRCIRCSRKPYDANCPICEGTGKAIADGTSREVRWAKLLDFKASSTIQVKDYIEATGQEVPFSRKKGKETTESKFLKRMQKDDGLFSIILRFRELQKMNTYLNWEIGEDGKVHSTFLPVPATGRLSSANPNFQNIPKESDLGNAFRECIVASPGCSLVRFDFSGFEALITGVLAKDEAFTKLATLGPYTFVMGKYLGVELSLDDPELGAKLKALKKQHNHAKPGESSSLYKKFKTTVLGLLYGLGEKAMFEENPGVFESQMECRKLRNFVFKTFPRIKKWQDETVKIATRQAYLMNPFNYIRWFFDLPGTDGPKAIAQRPQSTAAAIAKEAILRVAETEAGQYLVGMIHDELVFDCPNDKVERVTEIAKEIMQRPIPELNGLRFKVEGEIGPNLRKED